MTTPTRGNYEYGYQAVLVREEAKKRLREFRAKLPERDLFQERRIATAALEMAIEDASNDPKARERLFAKVKNVVRQDLDNDKAE